MKKVTLILALLAFSLGWSQNLPTAVTNAFDKQFPNTVITSWTDNSYYRYEDDWSDNLYYNDYDFNGYEDGFYYDGYGWGLPHFGYGGYYPYEYSVPEDYVIETKVAPTYYQLSFTKDNIKMTGIFKPNGTFVIAKGQVKKLPSKVSSVVMNKFKGKTIKFGHDEEKMIVPNSSVPVYRFTVEVNHAKNHIMKVDGNGKVISDTEG